MLIIILKVADTRQVDKNTNKHSVLWIRLTLKTGERDVFWIHLLVGSAANSDMKAIRICELTTRYDFFYTKEILYREYYMAARGYELYLWVLRVRTSEVYFQHVKIKFVSPSSHVMFCLLYRYWWNFHLKTTSFIHFRDSKKWSSITKCLSQRSYETRISSYKGKIKKIIFTFSVRKSKNSNKEEKNPITVPSSHLEAILWTKFQITRQRAWARSSIVIG